MRGPSRLKIKNLKKIIMIHSKELKQLQPEDTERMLGIYMNLALTTNKQFLIIKEKLLESITKLMRTEVNAFQAFIYFNMYMIRSIYFGVGVMNITKSQEVELKNIYEGPLLQKLQLGEKFPCKLLYAPWNSMEVGLL